MLVVLSGLPGVGKTTIARRLATAISAVYVRIDSIEQALRADGLNVKGEGYSVGYAVAEDNLRLGRTVIADCVNPWLLTRSEWQAVADRAAVQSFAVEIICSDVSEHRRRVESRSADITGLRLPTWSEVVERDYQPWNHERLIVDTAGIEVLDSVRTILSALSQSNDAPR